MGKESDRTSPSTKVLVIRKRPRLAPEFTENSYQTLCIAFESNHPDIIKRGNVQNLQLEILPYANNAETCLIKLTAAQVTFKSLDTPSNSLTQFLTIPKVAIVRKM
jgi:hypothetical protein